MKRQRTQRMTAHQPNSHLNAKGRSYGKVRCGALSAVLENRTTPERANRRQSVSSRLPPWHGMPEFGPSPVWALISSNGVASFPVLAGIECLWIAVDNDPADKHGRQAGNEAALACSKRWTEAGREVYRVTPDRVGRDLNDVMRSRATS